MRGADAAEDTRDFEEMEDAIALDVNNLEDCCATQPTLYYRVAKELAAATSAHDKAEIVLALTKACAGIRVRKLLEGSKPTEKTIEHFVLQDKKVVEALFSLQVANERIGRLEALEKAFCQRDEALSRLTSLKIKI